MIDAFSRFMILNLALRLLEPKILCSIAAAKANLATNPVFDRLDIMRLGRFVRPDVDSDPKYLGAAFYERPGFEIRNAGALLY